MNDLVLIKPIGSSMEPYTTTDRIAEFAEVSHKAVNQLIRRHMKDLELFGTVEFDVEACPHKTGASLSKIYHLNEQQATLFVTYLQNTPPVRKFKKALVHDFFLMREELTKRKMQREVKTPVRRSLTDSIRDSGEADRMKGYAFNTYTNLIYKAVTGKNAVLLRKSRGAPSGADVVGLLTADELAQVTKREAQVCTLLDCGMKYDDIRAVLLKEVHR